MGAYVWSVQPWGLKGLGLASESVAFTITAASEIPVMIAVPVIRLAAPVEPVFVWPAEAGARWYNLEIEKDGEPYISEWVEGTTTWSAGHVLPWGSYEWTVRSWGPDGFGAESAPEVFDIPLLP